MAATTEQKVDFLLKKIGYVASKTGIAEDENSLSGTKKAPFAEAIPSPLVTPSTSIWADASLIPATPPGSDTSYVRVYLTGTSGVRMTVDNTVSGNRTFIARSTYGNDSSAILGDWIDTSFGADYIIKVFKGDPNSGGVQLSAAGAGSNDTWFFDYSSGVLNFNGTQIPSGVTSSNIYIVGYRYIGAKGGRPAAGIATFASLDVSGISTFRDDVNFISANGNNILFDKSDNALEFGDNVKATFGDSADLQILHTGTYSNIYNATGDLDLSSNVIRLKNGNRSKTFAAFIDGGQSEFYYDNVKRFETTSTGAQVTGNLNVTGVLTYDDVTNIDSLGIVTARTGVDVNAGGINVDGGGLNIVGVSTFANNIDANGDLDVDGHTNLDNLDVVGVATFTGSKFNIESTGESFVKRTGGGGGAIALIVSGDQNGQPLIEFRHGGSGIGQIRKIGTSGLRFTSDTLALRSRSGSESYLEAVKDGAVELYYDDIKRFSTSGVGATVSGNLDITADLDVDGHTELDNVNISGLTTAALLNVSSLTDTRVTFASASGRLSDSANLTFDGTNLTAASAKISDLTSGRVVTAGTNGALQDSANLTFNGSLLDVTGNLAVSGNVSIAGTLTYQDVTNVDSVGIATARVGIKVLAGGVEIDGGGLDVQAGVSTFADDVKIAKDKDLIFHRFGTTKTLIRYHDTLVTTQIKNVSDNLEIGYRPTHLMWLTNSVLNTKLGGVNVTGDTETDTLTVSGNSDLNGNLDVDGTTELDDVNVSAGATFAGNIDANGDLDVDGHTELDNVNIAGVSTFTGAIDANGDLDVDGHTNLDNVSVAGVTTFSDDVTFETANGNNIVFDKSANDLTFGDNVPLYFGANNDLAIYHDTSVSRILDSYGHLLINSNLIELKNNASNKSYFSAVNGGHTKLFYNGNEKLATSGIGVTVTGETKTTTLNVTGITTTNNLNVTGTATIASIGSTVGISSNFYFGDDNRINMGDGDDLIIYHQSSDNNNYIKSVASPSLKVQTGTGVISLEPGGTRSFIGRVNAATELYYNGNKKLATTISGISVTGTTDTDNFVNAGVSTFVGIITASAVGNVIPFLFNNYSDLPAASSYHGAFAHVHTVAKGFFAHAGNWVEIVSKEADGRVGSGTETYNIKDLNITGITTIADDKKLYFGNDQDLELYYQTSGVAGAYLNTGNTSGNLTIRNQDAGQYVYIHGDNVHLRSTTNNEAFLQAQYNGAVSLYYDNAKKIETKVYGLEVTGTTDMDGLVVSGVSTFAGGSFSGDISAVNGTFSGNVSIAGTLTYQDVTNIDSVGIVTARTDLHVGTGATVIKTVNGQVGINSTIPAHMLDVGGVINSSTDVRVNNESLVTQNQALNDAVAMAIALG